MFPLLYFCCYRKSFTAADLHAVPTLIGTFIVEWSLWNTSFCLLLWWELLKLFLSFWWKESHLRDSFFGLKGLDSTVISCVTTSRKAPGCCSCGWKVFISHLSGLSWVIPTSSELTGEDMSIGPRSFLESLPVSFYSSPFVYSLNVYPPILQSPPVSHQEGSWSKLVWLNG